MSVAGAEIREMLLVRSRQLVGFLFSHLSARLKQAGWRDIKSPMHFKKKKPGGPARRRGSENPLAHLHEDEAPVQTDKLKPGPLKIYVGFMV